ncbi:MAG: Ldh family oxidoreductase [Candidatus Thiodiazotropha endolucinida]
MIAEPQPRQLVDVPLSEVERICHQALAQFITPATAVDETAAQLLDAELRGKHSHGVVRIPWLREKLGHFQHQSPEAVELLPWLLHLRCRRSLGYFAARGGQRQLLRMLNEQPFAAVVCSDAFPTGVVGDYLRPLAEAGFVAVGFATSPPLVSLHKDGQPLLGTNPLAIAMPSTADKPTFIADVSPAPTTFGQILAMLSGFEGDLKDVTLTTSKGQPATDLKELFDEHGRFSGKIIQTLDSGLQRRQYALSLAIEMLTTLFTGETSKGGLVILACDPQRIPGMHADAVVAVIERIAKHQEWQNIPGGHGEARRKTLLSLGSVPLPETLWQQLQFLANKEMAALKAND